MLVNVCTPHYTIKICCANAQNDAVVLLQIVSTIAQCFSAATDVQIYLTCSYIRVVTCVHVCVRVIRVGCGMNMWVVGCLRECIYGMYSVRHFYVQLLG